MERIIILHEASRRKSKWVGEIFGEETISRKLRQKIARRTSLEGRGAKRKR